MNHQWCYIINFLYNNLCGCYTLMECMWGSTSSTQLISHSVDKINWSMYHYCECILIKWVPALTTLMPWRWALNAKTKSVERITDKRGAPAETQNSFGFFMPCIILFHIIYKHISPTLSYKLSYYYINFHLKVSEN